MRYLELSIPGAWVIEHDVFGDERGELERILDRNGSEQHGIDFRVDHSLISTNPLVGTLRGFHFQTAPLLEAKTITCLSGSVYDVVVDLRIDSPSFCKWTATELYEGDHKSLHVPRGCANAWLTLQPETRLHYYMAEEFSPELVRGFRFDDPGFRVDWPLEAKVVAEKDLNWPAFDRSRDGLRT